MRLARFLAICSLTPARACTNIIVSRGASSDGSTIMAYNADDANTYGSLVHFPAADYEPGAMREVWDWDDAIYLGSIPEAPHTFNVVGNVNEHGLMIGESTFGGVHQLDGHGTGAILDYGSLMWITLQRARTAREAISTMDSLVQTYGYASDGESFTIADGTEAWLLEMIGKGKERGAVWVAMRVPDGFIGGTANQARIRTFPLDEPEQCLYSADIVSFAQRAGLYPAGAAAADFSFSDTFDPLTFSGARHGESRVWSVFQRATGGALDEYAAYARGEELWHRMPLFVRVARPLAVEEVMELMRTHAEGTWFDATDTAGEDVGAGAGHSPYRMRPLVWRWGGEAYVNERTVSTQQTAWAAVSQSRGWLPPPIRALLWWAPDDSGTAVRTPLYGGARAIPAAYGDVVGQVPGAGQPYGVGGDALHMDLRSAFWVYNLVAHMAYGERYAEAMPLIAAKVGEVQRRLLGAAAATDAAAARLLAADAHSAAAYDAITRFGVQTGQALVEEWRGFWMFLFARFRDGVTLGAPALPLCSRRGNYSGCACKLLPSVREVGYGSRWRARIAAETAARTRKANFRAEGRKVQLMAAKGRAGEAEVEEVGLADAHAGGGGGGAYASAAVLSFAAGVVCTLLVGWAGGKYSRHVARRRADADERKFHLVLDK
ncbi:hypothetical protein AB1Y20_003006 [Prymnesium parvum]|uniref:Membrane dipeptidase n=1 Tax=Prymnesium parvum TaxID=97485 RepID=A0AB34JAL4_PRYPA